MEILDNANVKGTFFIVGKALDADPQIARPYTDGHLVGNHRTTTTNGAGSTPLPELNARRTRSRTVGVPGLVPLAARRQDPADGAQAYGMRMAMWTSAGRYTKNDPQAVADRVLDSVRGGSIIDLREGSNGRTWTETSALVRALPLILDGLRDRHLRPVRLDELVGGPAYQTCAKHT
jgi:peptidoglycan/xylan/chitin deacetylase (PgdA/CDA1 family)